MFLSVCIGECVGYRRRNSFGKARCGWYYGEKIIDVKGYGVERMWECEEKSFVGVDLDAENVGKITENGNMDIIYLPVEEIMPNRSQPRRVFDNSALVELSESIRNYGVIQPIVVRKIEDLNGSVFRYELVAGERRLRAAKMADLLKIPCVLVDIGEKESAEVAIIENLHRKDLNIFETAAAISSLIEIYGVTQEEIARRLSITQSAVANKLRLLRLSEAEKRVILDNNLTERHARCLIRVEDEGVRWEILSQIVQRGLNVKESEEYINGVLEARDGVFVAESREVSGVKHGDCVNIIQKAIDKLRKAGCETKSTCTETDDFYIYTITVDK